MVKVTEREREESAAILRTLYPVGSTVPMRVEYVSRNGMRRHISVWHRSDKGTWSNASRMVAEVVGMPLNGRGDALVVDGCGMDMCFHLVYSLSRGLYRQGVPCTGHRYTGKAGNGRYVYRCRSNEHVNPGEDRDMYRRGRRHTDGGYALDYGYATLPARV